MPVKNLLVPGGLGFIGSHTVVHILEQTKCNVIILDDLSNCFEDVLLRMKEILSRQMSAEEINQRLKFHKGNILDLECLESLFKKYSDDKQPI